MCANHKRTPAERLAQLSLSAPATAPDTPTATAMNDGIDRRNFLSCMAWAGTGMVNGHIHQVVQKVEGNVAFHTATSTAFPQPAPGRAPSAGPMVVPAGKLRSVLGVTDVKYIGRRGPLAIIDSSLDGMA